MKSDNSHLYDYPIKTSLEDNYTEIVVFLSSTGAGAVFARKTHTYRYELVQPVTTSSDLRVCGSWRTPSRANKEDETHKTWNQQVVLLSEPVNPIY